MGLPYSFEKFNYLLRPSKQVERKLIVEALLRLQSYGYPIPSYTYLGFGSVYYADFMLFHKYLYINKMICAEAGNIESRMKFNKPFKCISLRMKPASQVFPELKERGRYVVWLDYDTPLTADVMQDINGCLSKIGPGSIVLLTVDGEARVPKHVIDHPNATDVHREAEFVDELRGALGKYVSEEITRTALDKRRLIRIYWEAIVEKIKESVSFRPELEFLQLFHFVYADNAQMLTVGGLLDTPVRIRALKRSDFVRQRFVSLRSKPMSISVPHLTTRERQWLDSRIRDGVPMQSSCFEVEKKALANYAKYYREYPTYVETIV